MPKLDNFDMLDDEDDWELPEETATSGSPVFGELTPEIIAEARAANGLDIEKFYKKYGLDVSIERLLLGPLDEDGNLK